MPLENDRVDALRREVARVRRGVPHVVLLTAVGASVALAIASASMPHQARNEPARKEPAVIAPAPVPVPAPPAEAPRVEPLEDPLGEIARVRRPVKIALGPAETCEDDDVPSGFPAISRDGSTIAVERSHAGESGVPDLYIAFVELESGDVDEVMVFTVDEYTASGGDEEKQPSDDLWKKARRRAGRIEARLRKGGFTPLVSPAVIGVEVDAHQGKQHVARLHTARSSWQRAFPPAKDVLESEKAGELCPDDLTGTDLVDADAWLAPEHDVAIIELAYGGGCVCEPRLRYEVIGLEEVRHELGI